MRHWVIVCLSFLLLAQIASAQQEDVQKWSLYGGYAYLNTPTNNLGQHGFNVSFGRNFLRWLAVGADFSRFSGSGSQSGAPLLPVEIPFDATTTTFAAGPQLEFRRYKPFTLFARPGFGVLHESVEVNTAGLLALLPTGFPVSTIPASLLKQSDTVAFYGAGGGIDLNVSKPIAIRFATDYIHTGLFSQSQNSVRLSVGLDYRFGGSINH